jgi:hypothetical protein
VKRLVQRCGVTRQFLVLQPIHNSHRWLLPVTREITAGPPDKPFLFGGVGLGSAIVAMERPLCRRGTA